MRRLCAFLSVVIVAVGVAGCTTAPTRTVHTGNANRDQVWIGTLDVVSNYLHVAVAEREKGYIEARSDGQWSRQLAKIQIAENAGQYDVTIGAYIETAKVLTRPSGLRAAEEEHLSDLDSGLRDRLVWEVEKRLNVPKKVKLAAGPEPAPKPAAPKAEAKPKAEKKPAKSEAQKSAAGPSEAKTKKGP